MNEDELVTAWINGLAPMASCMVPVGVVQAAPLGLQTPRLTVPPGPVGAKGKYGSVAAGTVIVNIMFEALTTFETILASATRDPPNTMPTNVPGTVSELETN